MDSECMSNAYKTSLPLNYHKCWICQNMMKDSARSARSAVAGLGGGVTSNMMRDSERSERPAVAGPVGGVT